MLAYDLDTIIEYMKIRPTDKNILRIKGELIALKQMHDNGKNSLISNSQLNKESYLLADKVQAKDPLVRQHRLINTYVDSYKLKLSLKEQ